METPLRSLDDLPFGRSERIICLVAGLAWTFVALNLTISAFVSASLLEEWNLSSQQVGLINAGAPAGMFVGAPLGGRFTDAVGRRSAILLGTGLAGILSILPGFAWDATSLAGFRVVSGAGLGAAMVAPGVLVLELSPQSHRAKVIRYMTLHWVAGSVPAAFLALVVVSSLDWSWAFFLGAMTLLLYIPFAARILPESPRWLVDRGLNSNASDACTALPVRTFVPQSASQQLTATANVSAHRDARAQLSSLLKYPWLRRTIHIWTTFFAISVAFNSVLFWLPSTLVRAGIGEYSTFGWMVLLTLLQFPGVFLGRELMDGIGRRRGLVSLLVVLSGSTFLFGLTNSSGGILIGGAVILFVTGALAVLCLTYVMELYPTRLRGSGLGYADALWRVGAVIGPLLVGALAAESRALWSLLFGFLAIALLVPAILILKSGIETKGSELEEVSDL